MPAVTHPLDLDCIRDLGDRARGLFDELTLRLYAAAVVGRQSQRAPYGSHHLVALPIGVSTRVAFNDSKANALRVYVDVLGFVPNAVVYSPSIDSGSVNYETLQSQAGGAPESFVLRPSEQLFVRAVAAPATVTVATEWY